jgi:hypothetical protein
VASASRIVRATQIGSGSRSAAVDRPCARAYAAAYGLSARSSGSRSFAPLQMPVPKPPGSTRTTLTPKPPTSWRSASESASSACFDAQYQPVSGVVTRPAMDETLTIRPVPRSRMPGSTSRQMRIGPSTFVSKISRAASSPTSSTGPAKPYPALFTTANSPSPAVIAATSANAFSVDSASATSQITCRSVAPLAVAASCSTAALASLRTVPITS